MLTAWRPPWSRSPPVRTGCGKSPIARSAHVPATRRRRPPRWGGATGRHAIPCPLSDRTPHRSSACSAYRPRPADLGRRRAAPSRTREEYEPTPGPRHDGVPRAWSTPPLSRRLPARPDIIVVGDGATTTSRFRAHPTSTSSWPTRGARTTPVGYYPGEAVLRTADVVVVNKANAAAQARTSSVPSPRWRVVQRISARPWCVGAIAPRGSKPAIPAPRSPRARRLGGRPRASPHGFASPRRPASAAAAAAGAIRGRDPRPALTAPLRAVIATFPTIGPRCCPPSGYDPVAAPRPSAIPSSAAMRSSSSPPRRVDRRHVMAHTARPILRVPLRSSPNPAPSPRDPSNDWADPPPSQIRGDRQNDSSPSARRRRCPRAPTAASPPTPGPNASTPPRRRYQALPQRDAEKARPLNTGRADDGVSGPFVLIDAPAPPSDPQAPPRLTRQGWPGCTGPMRYGRIISLSSCSTMWQCHTNCPGLVNCARTA
jgi:hypothetical protein